MELDSVGSQGSSNFSDTSSNSDINCTTNDHITVNTLDVSCNINEPSGSVNVEVVCTGVSNVGSHLCENPGDVNTQETATTAEECQWQVSDRQAQDLQHSGSSGFVERRDNLLDRVHSDWVGASQIEARNDCDQQEANGVIQERFEMDNQEDHRVEDIPWDGSIAESEHWHEQVALNEEGDRQHIDVDADELRDGVRDVWDDNHNPNTVDELQEPSGSEVSETNSRLQEVSTTWQENGVEGLFEGPSDQEFVPNSRLETFYLPDDDDNVYSRELRELVSR